jgi:NDP-sugar pyrophosphorylase family protein
MLDGKNIFHGENCRISEAANVSETVIWDDVKIESGARLQRTIIADGVTIKSGETFENSAIVRAEMVRNCSEVPEKALRGKFVGENYVVLLDER